MKPVSRVLAFKVWLSIALSIFLAICVNFIVELSEEGAHKAEEVLSEEAVTARRIEDRFTLDMRRIKQISKVLISGAPPLEETSRVGQKFSQWVKKKNDKDLKSLGVKIVYVGNKDHFLHVLDGDEDETERQYLLARYAEWIETSGDDYFYWQMQFSRFPNLLNVYAVIEQESLSGEVFHIIIRYESPININAFKIQREEIIFIDNNNIPLMVRGDRFMPVRLEYKNIEGLDTDIDSITTKLNYAPEVSLSLEVLDVGGIEYHQFAGEETLYLGKIYEIQANNWKMLILFDAKAITEGIEEELFEGVQVIVVAMLILSILTMLLYYHYKVRSLIYIDPLTSLFNRGHFTENINPLIELHDRGKISDLGVIAIDIDKFKSINDRYGHSIGDKVLKALSKLMRETTRKSEWVYRFGGEEFIILCSGESLAAMTKLAERLRVSVEQQVATKEYLPEGFTISLGVAARETEESIDKVLTRADDLLYKAKESGRNQVQV
ncbi:MAG: hypothetical protein CL693_07120 [Cellvibrionaceae bacterium]|nr:hypothetical protein [Cellvibrionaceae bacterium]|tara:strand:- start:333 stop:1814 length:1482 start_codon:yes stop_codon:yes gene_type:complete